MALVEAIRLPLEVVTPLFLAGAETRGEPELRPPAFRGALRYWLRAVLGGVLGADVAAVRSAEAKTFGNAERATGASAVNIRIHCAGAPASQEYRVRGSRDRPVGRDYLYWSMNRTGGRDGDSQPSKKFLPPGTAFDLIIAPRPGARTAARALTEATAALWLLVQLGGVGSRSRRTAGSLSPAEAFEREGIQFALQGGDPGAIALQLSAGLRRVRAQLAAPERPAPACPALPEFEVLHPDACKVWVVGTWEYADQAVDQLGAALREFRIARRGNVQPAPSLIERAIFGLPLRGVTPRPKIDRRASPLWLRVSRTADGRAVAVATLFRSRFLPAGTMLTAGSSSVPPPPNVNLIERWLGEKFPQARQVDYA